MAVRLPLVQGPDHVKLARAATDKLNLLRKSNWDFNKVPGVYARDSKADVVSKEMVHIFDGQRMTRVGRLVMGGIGSAFNLMGPIPSDSEIKMTDATLLDAVSRQLGTRGMRDHPDYEKIAGAQEVEFYNYGTFYTLDEMVFWLLLREAGCYPSTLAHMVDEFARGKVVQNYMFKPTRMPKVDGAPMLMQGRCMTYSFPSDAVQWMERPLYGGFAKDTMHVETLLTRGPSDVSHPYLELTETGMIEFGHQRLYARRFVGTTPKDAIGGAKGSEAHDDDAC